MTTLRNWMICIAWVAGSVGFFLFGYMIPKDKPFWLWASGTLQHSYEEVAVELLFVDHISGSASQPARDAGYS